MIPRRRWPRRLLVAVNIIAATSIAVIGSAYGYYRYQLDSIRTVAAPHLAPQVKTVDSSDGLSPENILLIGNETRAGLTSPSEIAQMGAPSEFSGSLSDVIMVLHLDPAKKSASILSIPRDLFLPMPAGTPAGPYEKVDAALNDGAKGADNLIQAITDDLGIPINHYVELEFDGFENTVNALGGINVDFPERLFDANSALSIQQTGCLHLDGSQALALVRSRHLQYGPPSNAEPEYDWPFDPESDLSRIVRDHTFLRVLISTAESQGITNFTKINAFLSAVINQVTIDPKLKNQLIPLGLHYRSINSATIPEVTLPITTVSSYYYQGSDIGDVDFPVQPVDNQVIAQWDGNALPAPASPTSVTVYNMAGTYNLASSTATALAADGLPATVAGDRSTPGSPTETFVQYAPGDLAQALDVFRDLKGAVMLDPTATQPAGTITVEAGSLLSVVPPASTQSASATTSTTAPVSVLPNTSTTSVTAPTPSGETPSASADQEAPWDPVPCPPGSTVTTARR